MRLLTVGMEETCLSQMLRHRGIVTEEAKDDEDVFSLLRFNKYRYDAVIANIMNVGKPFIYNIRVRKFEHPLIIMTGFHDLRLHAEFLDLGADACVNMPFHIDGLIAVIRAVVRRSQNRSTNEIIIGKFVLDTKEKTLSYNGIKIHLTRKEYVILECLMIQKDKNVRKEFIYDCLYGPDNTNITGPKIIYILVCRIRKRLVVECGFDPIITNWHRGYTFSTKTANEIERQENEPRLAISK